MSVSERWCRQWPRSFGCSQSSRRFGCDAELLASIMVGFLSSYRGYRGANGISDRNAKIQAFQAELESKDSHE